MTSVHPPKILEENIGLSRQKEDFRTSFLQQGDKTASDFLELKLIL